jgi:hypothetical protein
MLYIPDELFFCIRVSGRTIMRQFYHHTRRMHTMEMILVDWTRMGTRFCLAGVVVANGRIHVIRPLLKQGRTPGDRKSGWPAHALKEHRRWDVFELVGEEAATAEPPHLEDCWTRTLRPLGKSAAAELRRTILTATAPPAGQPLFGAALTLMRATAFLPPGTGSRSLVTAVVAARDVVFSGSWRKGLIAPDLRVRLPLPELGERWLPVIDHHLLRRARDAGYEVEPQVTALTACVHAMGEQVAVRLGLSRAFQQAESNPGACWLMADGFM